MVVLVVSSMQIVVVIVDERLSLFLDTATVIIAMKALLSGKKIIGKIKLLQATHIIIARIVSGDSRIARYNILFIGTQQIKNGAQRTAFLFRVVEDADPYILLRKGIFLFYKWGNVCYTKKKLGGNAMDAYSRTRLLLESDGMEKLKNAHIAVFGLGGVGSYMVEALARCGVGTLEGDHRSSLLANTQ